MDGNLPTLTTRSRKSLRVWPGNPRKTLPDLTDLTASIARLGVLTPLLIRPLATPDGDVTHEVIAGQCRYLAAGLAGLDEVPVNERDVDDCVALEIALTENAGREAPSPLEEAEALDIMVRVHHRTPQQIARALGRPLRWVERRLSLLKLVPAARDWLRAGRLPLAHALQLAAVDPATQTRTVERYATSPELPASKSFAHEITYFLRMIGSAPFDVDDTKLPGGACAKCTKRSDAQVDLFDTGRESGAHCLDNACWGGKVKANIERAKQSAEKRGLPVYEGDASRQIVGESYDGRLYAVYGGKYSSNAPTKDATPIGVAVTERGRVVDLYPKPAETEGDETSKSPEALALEQQRKAEFAERQRKWAEVAYAELAKEDAKRAAREKAVAALPLDQLARLAAISTHVFRGDPGFDAAGIPVPEKREELDAWARSLEPSAIVRAVLTTRVLEYFEGEIEDRLPADSLPLTVEILGSIYGVAKPEEPEPTSPAPKGKKGAKKAKNAEVVTPSAPVTNTSAEPSAQAAAPVVTDDETTRINGVAVGETITLDDVEVEILGVDADGFMWRTSGDRDRDEGDTEWRDVEHVEKNIWRTRVIEAPKAKRATKAEMSPARVELARALVEQAAGLGPDDFGGTDFPTPGEDASAMAATQLGLSEEEAAARRDDARAHAEAALEQAAAVTTLRVPRGKWLLHRSELRDTAKAPLHKKWEAVGEDRVATVPRGSDLAETIRAFCIANKVPLFVDDMQVSPPVEERTAPAKRAKKGGAK